MSDSIVLNPAAGGSAIATDNVGGFHHQKMKLVHGVDGVATDTTATDRFPVSNMPQIGVLTDRSGVLTLGGTAQQIAPANSVRLGFAILNLHASSDLWYSTLATAVQSQPSMRIPAGSMYETPPGGQGIGAISVIGPTTGQTFSVREW